MTPPPGFRVRLLRDMSRYGAGLSKGAEGTAALPGGRSALFRSDFVKAEIAGKLIDVRMVDLEIVDERWLAMVADDKKALEDSLANHVKEATVYTGGRGGFRKLVVEFSNARPNEIYTKRPEAQPVIDSLRERGLLKEKTDA